jgi:hypothetical protein
MTGICEDKQAILWNLRNLLLQGFLYVPNGSLIVVVLDDVIVVNILLDKFKHHVRVLVGTRATSPF